MMKMFDVLTSPWAILPSKFDEICDVYSTHLKGEKINIPDVESRLGVSLNNKEQGYDIVNGVAIVPVDGVIAKKMNLFSKISGGASTQLIQRDIENAINDPEVNAIILHIDSPGGTVDGTSELSEYILSVRGRKPIHSFADGLMASAAYWIGSAADQIHIASKTTQVGSIGVVCTHVDQSAYQEKMGIKTTEITSGKYKRIASNYEPLSEEGRADIQATSDYLYTLFVDGVAEARGVTSEDVLENMADGRLFIGQQAIDAGLVDGVSTLEQLIESLSSGEITIQTANAGVASSVQDSTENTTEEENSMEITADSLEKDHPEIAQHFVDKGKSQGAEAERKRITEVRDNSMPGHEALVETMMFDGETTGPQAAVKILQAEKQAKANAASNINSDAEDLNNVSNSVEEPKSKKAETNEELPLDEQIKKDWDASAETRTEFNGDFDSYSAFARANSASRVNVLGGKK